MVCLERGGRIALVNAQAERLFGYREHIRAVRPDVRVLFLSGYTQGLLGAHGILEPGVNLIEKPFSEASLLAKLTALASQGS
jgi:PAS domain-containing protein